MSIEQAKYKYGIVEKSVILTWISKFDADKKEQMSGKRTKSISPSKKSCIGVLTEIKFIFVKIIESCI